MPKQSFLSTYFSNIGRFFRNHYLLVIIIALGGLFRFYNLNWDFQHSFHPDERNILGQTASIQASTGYRVQFFAYGQLPVYLYRASGELISTPQALFDFFHGNFTFTRISYFFLLLLLGSFCFWLFYSEKPKIISLKLPEFGLFAFSKLGLLTFILLPIWFHRYEEWVQGAYWLSVLLLFIGIFWFFPQEKFKNITLGASSASILFVLFLYPRFFDVFSIWFNAIGGIPLKITSFVFVVAISLGLCALITDFLDIKWSGLPSNIALGSMVFLGVVPLVLPDAFARAFGVLAFILIIFTGFTWFAWVSRWGRLLSAGLALWAVLASFPHGGMQYTGYGECMIVGRFWAALFATLTILAVYLFVKRVYKKDGMALVAAASFSFAVISIENSHYCITESFITLMLMVMALLSYEISIEGSWKNYLLAGAAFGLSLAAKTSTLYYVFIFFLGHLLLLSKKSEIDWLREGKKLKRKLFLPLSYAILFVLTAAFFVVGYKFKGVLQDLCPSNSAEGTVLWVLLMVILSAIGFGVAIWGLSKIKVIQAQMPYWLKLSASGGLSLLLFCLLSPWSLLDIQKFMESQNYEWHVVSISDACYVLQFKDTLRYIYHLQNLMSVELWWPLGVTAVIGMVWVLGRFLFHLLRPVASKGLLPVPFMKGKHFNFSLPDLMLLCWFIPYFGFIGAWNTKFVRYMIPLIPVFCIFGARFLSDLFAWMSRWKFPSMVLKPLLTALVLGGGLFYAIAYMHVYTAPNPWIDSSVWIYKNVPPGSEI